MVISQSQLIAYKCYCINISFSRVKADFIGFTILWKDYY